MHVNNVWNVRIYLSWGLNYAKKLELIYSSCWIFDTKHCSKCKCFHSLTGQLATRIPTLSNLRNQARSIWLISFEDCSNKFCWFTVVHRPRWLVQKQKTQNHSSILLKNWHFKCVKSFDVQFGINWHWSSLFIKPT